MLPDYIQKRQEATKAIHGCDSVHKSTSVTATLEGKTAWDGEVETFDLIGHQKAKRCHAWGYVEDGHLRSTAVLDVAISAKSKSSGTGYGR